MKTQGILHFSRVCVVWKDPMMWMYAVISRTKRVCRNESSIQKTYEIGILCLAPPTLISQRANKERIVFQRPSRYHGQFHWSMCMWKDWSSSLDSSRILKLCCIRFFSRTLDFFLILMCCHYIIMWILHFICWYIYRNPISWMSLKRKRLEWY